MTRVWGAAIWADMIQLLLSILLLLTTLMAARHNGGPLFPRRGFSALHDLMAASDGLNICTWNIRAGRETNTVPHDIALVHKEKNSVFGVQFPDIPGCFTAADNKDNLVANATEALSLRAEDTQLPPPSSVEKIAASKAISTELAEGAFLLAIPYTENDTRVESGAGAAVW